MRSLLLAALWLALPAHAADLRTPPFLQSATPTSVWVVWETEGTGDSHVAFGPTADLGSTATASTRATEQDGHLHEAQLTELTPGSRVYYQVVTGDLEGPVLSLITPPAEAGGEPFRVVAMSDMQRAQAYPDKFREIVEDGVLAWAEDQGHDTVAEAFRHGPHPRRPRRQRPQLRRVGRAVLRARVAARRRGPAVARPGQPRAQHALVLHLLPPARERPRGPRRARVVHAVRQPRRARPRLEPLPVLGRPDDLGGGAPRRPCATTTAQTSSSPSCTTPTSPRCGPRATAPSPASSSSGWSPSPPSAASRASTSSATPTPTRGASPAITGT